MEQLITLTTDFGTKDSYVAAMKGVILSINRGARIVDLTHEISPQNIAETSLFLKGAAPYFPEGTIHVVVVDPGVGTERDPIAVKAGGQTFICPDNGLIHPLLDLLPFEEARVLANEKIRLPEVSATFHGRDIFSPAAAYLSIGFPFRDLGPLKKELIEPEYLLPIVKEREIDGAIMHIDHFGNLITNIDVKMLANRSVEWVKMGTLTLDKVHKTYGEAEEGAIMALIGSSGYLEVAVNGGSAALKLDAKVGDGVRVSLL